MRFLGTGERRWGLGGEIAVDNSEIVGWERARVVGFDAIQSLQRLKWKMGEA